MESSFAPIGQAHHGASGENSFWPSFTDIMMVITMIFLMATSLLVVRNWQLVSELKESVAAEQMASQTVETTVQENATLEERLANAEQSNSILRLRALKKDEELLQAEREIRQQQLSMSQLELEKEQLNKTLLQANKASEVAQFEIEQLSVENQKFSTLIANMEQQLAQQKAQTEQTQIQLSAARSDIASAQTEIAATRSEIASAQSKIASLTQSSINQQDSISGLTSEKKLLTEEIESYNQQLLTLKGDYEVVKSKYEELIKPARSAKGKYIAEVYYIKGNQGEIIRFKEPGDTGFTNLSLAEVEKRLDKLKSEKGKDLYVKIIIPQNSGLTYNEAWTFMRNLLVKYDYYHQEE